MPNEAKLGVFIHGDQAILGLFRQIYTGVNIRLGVFRRN